MLCFRTRRRTFRKQHERRQRRRRRGRNRWMDLGDRAVRDNDTGMAVFFFRGRSMTRPRRGELEKGVLSWDTSRHAIRCNFQGRTGVVDTDERDGEWFQIHGVGRDGGCPVSHNGDSTRMFDASNLLFSLSLFLRRMRKYKAACRSVSRRPLHPR